MPELPEVETVVRGLRLSLPGRMVTDVRFGKTDFVDDVAAIAERLPGTRISAVKRLGKFICIELNSGAAGAAHPHYNLIIHLGMTGQLTLPRAGEAVVPHTHVFFGLDDGRELRYTDIRRFGRMLLVAESELASFLARLGKEPLEIGAEEFCALLRSRGARIKALLLDQRVLGGIGNIYADESLFRARLHPMRIAERLAEKQLLALHAAIRAVLADAIRLRGSSISDYVDSNGNRGEFQLRHRVYQREGKPCFRCKSTIRRVIVAGRSSHYCPRCQPPPRAPGKTKALKPRMRTDKHGLNKKAIHKSR
jgi:formamidopyrimidine-DNA glycosylase